MKKSLEHNEELRRIYQADGLRQIDLAAILGVGRSTVQEYLADVRPMPSRALRLLKLETGRARPAWKKRKSSS